MTVDPPRDVAIKMEAAFFAGLRKDDPWQ